MAYITHTSIIIIITSWGRGALVGGVSDSLSTNNNFTFARMGIPFSGEQSLSFCGAGIFVDFAARALALPRSGARTLHNGGTYRLVNRQSAYLRRLHALRVLGVSPALLVLLSVVAPRFVARSVRATVALTRSLDRYSTKRRREGAGLR